MPTPNPADAPNDDFAPAAGGGTLPAPPAEPPSPTRRGRGPTSPAVKFAKLVEDVADHSHRAAFLDALTKNRPAKDVKACAKACRLALKLHTETETTKAEILDETAEFLERAEELPESLRRALIATLEPETPKP